MQPRDLGSPVKEIINPIQFENLNIYHFACLNIGQNEILSVDMQANSEYHLKVQKQIYEAYAKLSSNVSKAIETYTEKIYQKLKNSNKHHKNAGDTSDDDDEFDIMKYVK
jgi:hypothetical protein